MIHRSTYGTFTTRRHTFPRVVWNACEIPPVHMQLHDCNSYTQLTSTYAHAVIIAVRLPYTTDAHRAHQHPPPMYIYLIPIPNRQTSEERCEPASWHGIIHRVGWRSICHECFAYGIEPHPRCCTRTALARVEGCYRCAYDAHALYYMANHLYVHCIHGKTIDHHAHNSISPHALSKWPYGDLCSCDVCVLCTCMFVRFFFLLGGRSFLCIEHDHATSNNTSHSSACYCWMSIILFAVVDEFRSRWNFVFPSLVAVIQILYRIAIWCHPIAKARTWERNISCRLLRSSTRTG